MKRGTSDLLEFERRAWAGGFRQVAGVDEVGRGPLAGPVVAAAVILPVGVDLPLVNDSKQLTAGERDALAAALIGLAGIAIGMGIVSVSVIDRHNILRATHMAMHQAVANLRRTPDYLLIDGRPVAGFGMATEAIVKGDGRSASIAAASILAKVHRDRLMDDLDRRYAGYGFSRHKGYGTPEHLDALRRLGPCPEHRRSFAPVRVLLPGHPVQREFSFCEA